MPNIHQRGKLHSLSPATAGEGFAPAEEHLAPVQKERRPLIRGLDKPPSAGMQHRSPESNLWHDRTRPDP